MIEILGVTVGDILILGVMLGVLVIVGVIVGVGDGLGIGSAANAITSNNSEVKYADEVVCPTAATSKISEVTYADDVVCAITAISNISEVNLASVIENSWVVVSRESVIVAALIVDSNVQLTLSVDPYNLHPTGSRGVSSFAVTQSYASNVISVVLSMNKLDDPWVPGATLPPVV